jgi:hypothetical protein
MDPQTFEISDQVSVEGDSAVWTIVGSRSLEPCWQIQRGRDAATIRFVRTETLILVQKAEKPDTGPGFYPPKSIME